MPGPPPKHPDQKVGRSGTGQKFVTVDMPIAKKLPTKPPKDLLPEGVAEWPAPTLRWWSTWRDSPMAQNLPEQCANDFEEMAVLHYMWVTTGKLMYVKELRVKEAGFGGTPADLQRLRILVGTAEEKDKKTAPVPAAREAYKGLRAV